MAVLQDVWESGATETWGLFWQQFEYVCLDYKKLLLGLIPGCQISSFWLVWDPNHRPNVSVFDNQANIFFLQIVSVEYPKFIHEEK